MLASREEEKREDTINGQDTKDNVNVVEVEEDIELTVSLCASVVASLVCVGVGSVCVCVSSSVFAQFFFCLQDKRMHETMSDAVVSTKKFQTGDVSFVRKVHDEGHDVAVLGECLVLIGQENDTHEVSEDANIQVGLTLRYGGEKCCAVTG